MVMISLSASACAKESPIMRPELDALLQESKFMARDDYTGADTPDDRAPLQRAVDDAILDIMAMPSPLDRERVRNRLMALSTETFFFATEDRDEVARYGVRIWRALGLNRDGDLYPNGDDFIMANALERLNALER
jgi:hypothetical protein